MLECIDLHIDRNTFNCVFVYCFKYIDYRYRYVLDIQISHLVCLFVLFLIPNDEVHLVEQNCCVLSQGCEHEEDAGQHPGLDSRQTLRLRGVGRHVVEDVHENQEQGHQQSHTPWYMSLLLTLMTR